MVRRSSKRASATTAFGDVPPDAWRRVYDAAARVRAMEPWSWMYETDIFGVQDPRSDQVVFVSVMGMHGEYRAVALYPGVEALARFCDAHNTDDNDTVTERIMGTYQVHAQFEERSELAADEKRLLKELGLTFKGAFAWPSLVSRRPGYHPWRVDAVEARLLTLALEQLLDVAPRFRAGEPLQRSDFEDNECLVRVPVGEEPISAWRDERRAFAPRPLAYRIAVTHSLMDEIRGLEATGMTLEVDLFPVAAYIGKRGERCLQPFLLMVVEPHSGLVIGADSLTADPTWEDMWASVPARVLSLAAKMKTRPGGIVVRSLVLFTLLKPVGDELGIQVSRTGDLKALDEARRGFEQISGL